MKKIFLTMLMAVAFVAAKAVTATIYVQAEEAPYLYGWYTIGKKETKINGAWPGTQMTESVTKVNKNGESITFWCQTFTNDASSFNIIFNNGLDGVNKMQTGNISNIASDRYFTYDGKTKYTDITEDFDVEVPDVEIQTVALLSALNDWDGLAQLFTEVEPNAKYTFNLDLSNVEVDEDYYYFKIMVNSSAYFGWGGMELDDPNEWMEEDLMHDGGNIGIPLDDLEVRAILFTVTFAGGKDIYQGWTLKAEQGKPDDPTGISGIADNVSKQPVTRYNLSGQQDCQRQEGAEALSP